MNKIGPFLRMLGPGLLYAGAAIGVSHLVQSTRAGAMYGFDLVWVIIAAHILKYPAFEFAPRFASATGTSLVEGYHKIGRWALWVFALMQILTMFAVLAAISMVTAGLFGKIFHVQISNTLLSTIILILSTTVLVAGRFAFLDKLIKFIILLLTFSTLAALLFAMGEPVNAGDLMGTFNWRTGADIAFIIAFVGWMPAPLDLSVWHSQWSLAKSRLTGKPVILREALIDFRVGFFGTAVLAICFLALGALVMHGSGEVPASDGVSFAGQLLNMYTLNLGGWAYPIIAAAALTTMFSTTITVIDGYPRALEQATELLLRPGDGISNDEVLDDGTPSELEGSRANFRMTIRYFWMALLVGGAITLISYLSENMRFMVDLATTLSFTITPVLALFNYLAMNSRHITPELRPSKWLNYYALASIILLTTFSVIFILWRFHII